MTAIVGLIDRIGSASKVFMGCDSQYTAGWRLGSCETKIIRINEALLGSCGPCRITDALQVGFTFPKIGEKQDIGDWMLRDFIPALKSACDARWFKEKDGLYLNGNILVGFRGRLFEIFTDLSCIEAKEYAACGSGEMVALGSLYSTRALKLKPEQRIRTALEAAERYAEGVRGPFRIEHC